MFLSFFQFRYFVANFS